MHDLLTAEQVAGELGYTISYMYKLLKKGTVKAQQFNRVWMIDPAEVERTKALQGPRGRLPRSVPEKSNQ